MSLFDENAGTKDRVNSQLLMLPMEARIHASLAELASNYVKLIRKAILPKLDLPKGYSIRDVQVLSVIGGAKGPVTSSQIYRSTGLDPATVTRSVKTLSDHGHISVFDNEEDSRSRLLKLTNEGQSLSDRYTQSCQKLFASEDLNIPNVSNEDFVDLQNMLNKLKTRVRILDLKSF